ncbi:MAG: c-type cytochrome [Thiohalobacterales bacterium]
MRLTLWVFLMCLIGTASAAPDGAQLYMTHCATCHGDKGDGGVGVPLSLPAFLESVDDSFLRKTIRLGRPGRVMPAFRALGDAQVDAIVSHIRNWSGKPAPVFPDTPIKGDVQHGKELFASYCAACHGEMGEGGSGTGVTFSRKREQPIIAPALNNPGFLAAASDEMIRYTLQQGRAGTPMRSFLVQGLSEQDINDLVSAIRSMEDGEFTGERPEVTHEEAVIIVESPYTLDETVENLKESLISQNFKLIRTDYLEHGLVEEGQEDKRQVILHFCNFKFLFEALAIDPRVGIFLPCRVTVVERGDKVQVMTINPLYLSSLFNNDDLDEACKEMYGIYSEIIEDATL